MIIKKGMYHLNAGMVKLWYKCIYGKKVKFNNLTFRRGFQLCISEMGGVKFGKDVFFNNYCSVNSIAGVDIGDETIFGESVKIYDHNHRFRDNKKPIKEQGYTSSPIKIGRRCWIGSGTIILKGAKIGDNCVIGAGCLIDREIPANTVVKCGRNLEYIKKVDY